MKARLFVIGLFLFALAACVQKAKVPEPVEGPSEELSAIDSLMWKQPDSAFAMLQEFVVSPKAKDLDAFNGHYCQLLISELLYKNDCEQTNREDLLKAVRYFDSLCVEKGDAMGRGDAINRVSTVGEVFLDARAHYINGVGYYEQGNVVQACAEYLKALEKMEERFVETELVGKKAQFMTYIYNRLGDMFEEQLLAEPAIVCYKQALFYCRREPTSKYGIPVLLYRLGIQYNITGQIDSAAFYYDNALANMPDFDNLHYRDLMVNKTIFAYYNLNYSSDSLINDLKQLVALSTDEEEKTTRLLTLGNILFDDKQYDSSRVYLEIVFEQQEDITSKIMAAENLCNIYQLAGDSTNAQKYASFLVGYTMSEIENKTIVSKVNEMFKNYLTQKQEKRAEIERENAVKRVKSIIIPIAVVVMLVVVCLLILRSKKQLKNQQEEADRVLGASVKEHEKELKRLHSETEQRLAEVERKHQQWMAETKGRHDEELKAQKDRSEKEIENTKRRHERELELERLAYEKEQDTLRQNLKDREAQIIELEKTMNLQREEAKQRRMAFLKEPICQYILDKARSKQITTRDVAHELGIALKDKDFEQVGEAVKKHYKGFDHVLLSQCPSLKQGLLSLCHLYLLGLNESEIAALKNLSYSAIKKQNESLQEKLGVNEDIASYVLKVAEGLCGTQNGTQGGTQTNGFIDDLDAWIERQIKNNPKITTEELAEKSHKGVRTIKRHISTMGNIRYVGSGYSGHWEVVD